jgi:hypothetical protein
LEGQKVHFEGKQKSYIKMQNTIMKSNIQATLSEQEKVQIQNNKNDVFFTSFFG